MLMKRSLLGVFCVLTTVLSLHPVVAQEKNKRSVDGLVYDLRHPEVQRRKEAARALGKNEVHEAVPDLIELTHDSQDSARLEALRALVRINDARALQAYTRLTRDPDSRIQEKAIEGIINVYVVEESGFVSGVKQFVDLVNPFSDDYNPLMVEPYMPVSESAVNALADLLVSADSGTRKKAAVALGILRAAPALPALQQALGQETSDGVNVELIRAIYKIGDASAGQAIMPFIHDPDKKVHDEAIFTLGRLRVTEAVPQLKELYQSGVEERKKILGFVPVTGRDDLQKKLLEALAYIGDPSCREVFEDALSDPRDFYRSQGAEGLGRIGDQTDVNRVAAKYLREESDDVKLAMSYALFRLGREEHLVELVDNVGKDQAYYYFLEMDSRQIEQLYPYLQGAEDSSSLRLLEVVGLRAGVNALPVVEQMMQSPDPEVASAANLAARRIQGRNPS